MRLKILAAAAAVVELMLAGCGAGGAPAPQPTTTSSPTPTPTPTPSPTPSPTPTGAVFQPVGVYALTSRNQTTAEKQALVALPFVDGMTSFVGWSDIEPVKGQYDFSRIDADIAIAAAAGKKISIGVFTGKNTIPSWVAAEGVQTWLTSQGDTMIYPTDPKFVTLWSERVALLGQRYDLDPTVVQVGICGAAGTLCGPRYPELPAAFTLDQLTAAWTPIVAAYVQAFPNTYKHLEVHSTTNGLGASLPVALFGTVAGDVKIGPFAEFLSDTQPSPTSGVGIAFAQIRQGRDWCAFQMVGPQGALVGDAIALGKSYGCNYFEIYKSDLENYGALITAAKN